MKQVWSVSCSMQTLLFSDSSTLSHRTVDGQIRGKQETEQEYPRERETQRYSGILAATSWGKFSELNFSLMLKWQFVRDDTMRRALVAVCNAIYGPMRSSSMHTFCAYRATDNKPILHTSRSLCDTNMTNGTAQAPFLTAWTTEFIWLLLSLHGRKMTQI